ncbi:glycosyltransferase family protein [Gelidibacter gilvus]|uniref:Glycosyltransferase family 1 protein n=1 Tax=Gelidibacter gilvus TaxID=59602 RepID=A0A4Q0XBW6_9FLAO|nr:glycosyltransferase family 1 protein [Gelidibacter gilvus]RXJ45401.1 glycosyltransferase family 1 protein [Gelidibacter gilvus]
MNSCSNNILVVVESIDIDDSSGTKGRIALIHSLVNAGYKLTVLHFTQKEIQLEGIDCYAINERKYNIIYLLSRVQRLLNRWFSIDISKYVDTLFGFSFGFFNDAKSLEKAIGKYDPVKYDMVWTLSKGNSYRSHKAVLELPQWHDKWYAYVHDPFPQQLYPRPYNYVPYGYKKQRYFFREIAIKAKRLVFPSLKLKEWMQSYYEVINGKSLIVPHQLLQDEVHKMDLPIYFKKEKFNILFAGNLLDLRDPKPIVEAYRLFLNAYPDSKENSTLIFLGGPSKYDTYLLNQQKSMPSLYVSDGYVPFAQVYRMQQETSVNLILEAKSEISPFLPGKFPHCVAANKPIVYIGPYYSECKRLLGKEYPYVFDFEDSQMIATAFSELYEKWKFNPDHLILNRPDLIEYLISPYLKKTLTNDNVC